MTAALDALVEAAELGLSARETADRLGVSERTVWRWRSQTRLPWSYCPPEAPHGTRTRYRHGCDCTPCRAANAAVTAAHRATYARAARHRGGQLTLI